MGKAVKIISISFAMVFGILSNAQNVDSLKVDEFRNYVDDLPRFTIYGDNYIITGARTDKDINSEDSDAKIQFGFKQRIVSLSKPANSFIFFTYRQKSFWSIYKESFPFRETNYNPSIGITKLFGKNGLLNGGATLSLEHESNGLDGLDSRSWNLLSLNLIKPYRNLLFELKVWMPLGSLISNPDIISYRGLGYVNLNWNPSERWFFNARIQPAYKSELTGHLLLGISYRMSKKSNHCVYLQYFGGYGEDLINYNASVSYLRIGIALKDLLL